MLKIVRENLFVKILFSHLTLTVLLIMISLGIWMNRTADMITEEMHESGVAQLTSIKDKIEYEQLESYNSVLLNKAMSTIRSQVESELQFFLNNGKGDSYYRILRFTDELKALSISLPIVHNVSIYIVEDNFVLDQYFYEGLAHSPQADLFSRDFPVHNWFERVVMSNETNSEVKVLTYIYSLPYLAKGEQIKGYMIIDVDLAKLVAQVTHHLQAPHEKIAIFNESLQLVASSIWEEGELDPIKEHLVAMNQSDEMIKQDEKILTFVHGEQSRFGWHYILLRPQNLVLVSTEKLIKDIWVIGLIITLLGGIASLLMSRNIYIPFRFLEKQRKTYMIEAKQNQWREVLQGTSQLLDDKLLIPKEGHYWLINLKVEGVELSKNIQYTQSIAIENKVNVELLMTSNNEITIIFWSQQFEGEILPIIEQYLHRIVTLFDGAQYRAGVGQMVKKLDDVHIAAAEAQRASEYGFFSEQNVVIAFDHIKNRKNIYPKIKLDIYETLLKSGRLDEIEQFLTDCEAELRNPKYSIEVVKHVLMQLQLLTSKERLQVDGNEAESYSILLHETLGRTIFLLKEMTTSIVEHRSEKRNERYERIFDQIKTHIDENVQNDISLEELSSMVGYSKQFVCRLFKEETQMTIVEYMTQTRLEFAAKLLREGDDSVGIIAERSGFRSSQYFSNKFKLHYGVTPVQYRQAR